MPALVERCNICLLVQLLQVALVVTLSCVHRWYMYYECMQYVVHDIHIYYIHNVHTCVYSTVERRYTPGTVYTWSTGCNFVIFMYVLVHTYVLHMNTYLNYYCTYLKELSLEDSTTSNVPRCVCGTHLLQACDPTLLLQTNFHCCGSCLFRHFCRSPNVFKFFIRSWLN